MNNIFEEAIRAGMEAGAKALKPCPFCGGRYLGLHQETNADGEYMMYIECHACGARGGLSKFPYPQFADVRHTWNDRVERHGRWICENLQNGFGKITCSLCGESINVNPPRYDNLKEYEKFCANCGAKMEMG